MKSIKPGRGPSMMSGIGGIFAALFGVFWTITAASMGAGMMVPFGLIFIGIAVVNVIYNFKNATSENRYSSFDITEDNEEPDPLNERFGNNPYYDNQYNDNQYGYNQDDYSEPETRSYGANSRFCPYCGNPVEGDFEFCNICGKKLP